MKKKRIVFPVLILICAGMVVMTGCPSDPEPETPISDYNMVFEAGIYNYPFTTPQIEDGKKYEVILTIENCDDVFIGSQLGGKICYKDADDNEYVLSGWSNPTPGVVSSAKTYKWTFTAGQKNKDDVVPVSPATTPSDGRQFFHFEAQTSDWKPYGPNDNFRIKGGFVVQPKQVNDDWTSAGTVTLGNEDGIIGKGTLSAADSAKIRDMPAGSKIVITVTANVGAVGSGSNEPGWGVGSVGGWAQNNADSIEIKIPGGTPAGEKTFDFTIEISAIKSVFPAGNIGVNLWNDTTASKLELFRPANAAPTTWVSAGDVTLGNADGVPGKGTFSDADMTKINGLPANSKIAITVSTVCNNESDSGPKPGWGVASIGGWSSDNSDNVSIVIPPNTASGPCTFTVEIKISDIRAKLPTGAFSINAWGDTTITKAELFKPGT